MSLPKWLGIELIEVSTKEKLIAAIGGGISICALLGVSLWALPASAATVIVTSMGASAVLLFAVPHGPLSQPWPVLAGQGISATIGVACAQSIAQPEIAAACAVGLSIGAMHQLKCIHPPGGATAFSAVMGGAAIRQLGFSFVLFPVLINSLIMVLLAIVINWPFRWRRYPASLAPPHRTPPHPETESDDPSQAARHESVLAAIRSLDSFVDISEDDLTYLAELLAHQATQPPAHDTNKRTPLVKLTLARMRPKCEVSRLDRISGGGL